MNFVTLYTTNTLHLIATYLSLSEQLALRCLNRRVYGLSLSFLPKESRAYLSPEDYNEVCVLQKALALSLERGNRERRNRILPLLRGVVPVVCINARGFVTPYLWSFLSQRQEQGFVAGLFELNAEVLYEDVILRDRATRTFRPLTLTHKRIVYLLDTTGSLSDYDFTLDCQVVEGPKGSVTYTNSSYQIGEEVAAGAVGAVGGEMVISTHRGSLIEVLFWHLWAKQYYGLEETFVIEQELNLYRGAVRAV